MPTEIEVQTATPREHAEFIGGMPEFDDITSATACAVIPNARIVSFVRRKIIGGACYVSGGSISSAALIHLFGLLEGHRGKKTGALALTSLEGRMAQEG